MGCGLILAVNQGREGLRAHRWVPPAVGGGHSPRLLPPERRRGKPVTAPGVALSPDLQGAISKRRVNPRWLLGTGVSFP